ncbi:hypothetical protein L4D20_06435 [Vibrio kyushuensis]|uniref:hypothetical protein n=1 Tax=Vibrio kyushuensis TaxID=2910249 RepID=UPI003D14E264
MSIELNDISDVATAIAAVIAAISLGVSAFQTRLSRRIAETAFEDSIDQQYRELAKEIPVDVLIDRCTEVNSDTREVIFNYLDLCNQQVYLRAKGRISDDRWVDWCDGIQENLVKSAFLSVWTEVQDKASFSYLNRLENESFKSDPLRWK